MNVNIPPTPPTPQNPANKHKDNKHTEEKNEDSTRPLNSVDTINININSCQMISNDINKILKPYNDNHWL